MGIERTHRDKIADSADLHIDKEQQLYEKPSKANRIALNLSVVHIHDIGETTRQNGNHEGDEEPFDDPAAPVFLYFIRIIRLAPQQHRTEMP